MGVLPSKGFRSRQFDPGQLHGGRPSSTSSPSQAQPAPALLFPLPGVWYCAGGRVGGVHGRAAGAPAKVGAWLGATAVKL